MRRFALRRDEANVLLGGVSQDVKGLDGFRHGSELELVLLAVVSFIERRSITWEEGLSGMFNIVVMYSGIIIII